MLYVWMWYGILAIISCGFRCRCIIGEIGKITEHRKSREWRGKSALHCPFPHLPPSFFVQHIFFSFQLERRVSSALLKSLINVMLNRENAGHIIKEPIHVWSSETYISLKWLPMYVSSLFVPVCVDMLARCSFPRTHANNFTLSSPSSSARS